MYFDPVKADPVRLDFWKKALDKLVAWLNYIVEWLN